jgi:hypothetical protein
MVRWAQAPMSDALLGKAKAVFRPDLYDAALGPNEKPIVGEPADGIGAFVGPPFNPENVVGHLPGQTIKVDR